MRCNQAHIFKTVPGMKQASGAQVTEGIQCVHKISQKLRQLPDRAGSAVLANNGTPHQLRLYPLVRGKIGL